VALLGLLLGGAALLGGCADRERPEVPDFGRGEEGEGEGEGVPSDLGGGERDLGDAGPRPDLGGPDGGLAGYREPCLQNGDCESGWCVPYLQGHVCTQACDKECEEGWFCRIVGNMGSDVVSICMPPGDLLCAPCTSPADCDGGFCLPLDPRDGRSYCLQACTAGACRAGFVCDELVLQEESLGELCLPVSGTCSCTEQNEGLDRLCTVGNELGTCLGREVCQAAEGWVGCTARTPVPELCNLVDDDCNGLVDDVTGLGEPCTRDLPGDGGVLSCPGTFACVADELEPRCLARDPAPESCNGLDDDCDGEVDEDFPELGTTCSSGVGGCRRFGFVTCDALTGAPHCSAAAGEPGEERCDGLDNDCDESTDEGFADLGRACTVGEGACFRQGVLRCSLDGTKVECSVGAGAPRAEVCDGLDNDCDGEVDEDFPELWEPCRLGEGTCQSHGFFQCAADGLTTECNATPIEPHAERCDGLDNDCDGEVDEDFAGLLRPCVAGHGICARSGVLLCTADGTGVQCNATPGEPGVEICDGLDNDCDEQIDEGYPGLGGSCFKGIGECQRPGVVECADNGLTTQCRAQEGEPGVEVCDLLDNDCNGRVDDGWLNNGRYDQDQACGNCFTDCTRIYQRANAYGRCALDAGEPTCVMRCCRAGDDAAGCDAQAGLLDAFDLNLVPGDGCEFLLDPTAIYVSASDPLADDTAGCGHGPSATGEGRRPCLTIRQGLAEAKRLGRVRVLVADGLYEELVHLQDGISLLGGYRSDTWERHLAATGTILRGSDPGVHERALVAEGITSPTLVEGFILYGPAATASGGNSYVAYVRDCTAALELRSNIFYAGSGGPGLGQPAAERGLDGVAGQGRPAGTTTSTSPNLPIPDWSAAGVSSTLQVAAGCPIAFMTVQLKVEHSYVEDLIVTLTSPAGTIVTLHNRGSLGTDLDGSFNLSLPVSGPGSLAAFAGQSSTGRWTLNVADRAFLDSGTLKSWGMTFSCSGVPYDAHLADDATPCDATDDRQYANGGHQACGGLDVSGGAGGGNRCQPRASQEYSGLDGAAGKAAAGGGAAGGGGDAGDDGEMRISDTTSVCTLPPNPMTGASGGNGAPGAPGEAGSGCGDPLGRVVDGHWVGGEAASGAAGKPGGGGGGGGAGGGGQCSSGVACSFRDRLGAHGGGGGSGGCGGTGGSAGGSGGASFALFVLGGEAPRFTDNTLFLGIGGDGGGGGNGGVGGNGGHGAEGGRCSGTCWCYQVGGKGGEGGEGGHGGGGGGGCGGGAFGVFTADLATPADLCAPELANTVSGGVGGAPGAAGISLGRSGAPGLPGLVRACVGR
jgi:subtilisin-like proprotein convertase family protein